jgi:ankyrin repeat protein
VSGSRDANKLRTTYSTLAMDPLSAIGLASAVVQFITFGLNVVKHLDELNSNNPGEVPRSLRSISMQLPLLINALSRVKSDAQIKNLDFDTKCILRGMVSGCMSQVAEVEDMIQEISSYPAESFKSKIKKVFKTLNYDDKVREIERNLHTYISVLILHHVIDSAEAPLPPVDDVFFDVRERRVSPFVERPGLMEKLDGHLHAASRSQTASPTILHLAGEKGVGKTQLALEFCHQAHSLGQFRTVFWLDASSLENLGLGFESIYATIKRSTNGSRAEKVSFVREFFNDLWHPWLLVLDNYDIDTLYNEIMDFLPTQGCGGIILITRSQAENGLGQVLRIPTFLALEDQNRLNSLLGQEVQEKNINGIKDLVNQGADVNTLIWGEWPILHRCALFGLEEAVVFLLDRGADPNPPIKTRKPLYWAATNGHVSICGLLLDREDATGQLSTQADYQAAFGAAAEEGNLEIVRMILARRGVGLNNKNQYGDSPLQSAARKGHVALLGFLVEQGALIEENEQADQALISAVSAGHLEIVKILCTTGKVSPNAQDGQGRSALYYAADLKDPDSRKENGEEMARFLLEKGADPNPTNGAEGPLIQAVVHGHINMIRLLLEHHADPTRDSGGWCPLTSAIKYNSTEAMTVLLEAKVDDATVRKAWLEDGLRYACREGDRSAALQLLKAGADINAVVESGPYKGSSPLLLAIANDHIKTAQLLIRQGALQDLADEGGLLPLACAAKNGYDILVRDLVRAGGNPDLKSGPNEDTLLILAVENEREKVIKVLLQNGADKELTNKFGDLALDIAEEKGNKDIIELLES